MTPAIRAHRSAALRALALSLVTPPLLIDEATLRRVAERHHRETKQSYHCRGAGRTWQTRAAVNYLRHRCTGYHAALETIERLPRSVRVYVLHTVRLETYGAIERAYPHLAAECRYQMDQRRKRPRRGAPSYPASPP